jgi:hypothetical protein
MVAERFALFEINQSKRYKTILILNTVRLVLLTFLAEKRRILGRKYSDKYCNE